MKIINEKGKLFGLVNIVDLVVALVIIAAIAAIATSLLGSKVTDAVSEKADCYGEVVIIGCDPRIYNEVLRQDLEGQKLVSGNEYLNATVEYVWIEDYVVQTQDSEGVIHDAKDPTKKNIIIVVKTQVAPDTASPKIGSQELRAGRTLIVKTQKFESSGTIRYVNIGSYDSPYFSNYSK
jgi:hypothetical protein